MDVRMPDGRILRNVPEGTTKAQIVEKLQRGGVEVPQEWLTPPAPVTDPAPNLGAANMPLIRGIQSGLGQAAEFTEKELTPAKMALGAGETGLAMGTGMAAMPAAGLGGLLMNKFSPVGAAVRKAGDMFGFEAPNAADTVGKIQEAMTYQPRTAAGQLMTQGVAFPFEQAAKGADAAGDVVNEATGSPALATATNVGLQSAPMLVAGRGARARMRAPESPKTPKVERIAGETPKERAANYVNSRTSLAWDRLSRDFQRRLEEVAATGSNLEKLDATAIERQGLLASLDRPITNPTRGQVTRDPLQQRTEQLLKATEKGAELKVRDLEHNAAILENLDILQGRTGGKAVGDIQTGQSVQGALRERRDRIENEIHKRYAEAEEAGELQGPVNIDPLIAHLNQPINKLHTGYARDVLKNLGAIKEETAGGITVSQARPLKLSELEELRKIAGLEQKDGGTKGHYAGELKDVIDKITEGAGGEKYAEARAFRRALGNEFERQGAIARLVEDKHMSRDRATALEDTWHRTVLQGSVEDLKAVNRSLMSSGPKGFQAWDDLKAATVSYIKDKATGGSHGLKNEKGDAYVTWAAMKRAVDEIGADKLRELFGPEDAKKIETIVEAVQILKTEAPTGVKGSPTIDKLLTALDKIGKVPFLGKVAEAGKVVAKVRDIGKTGRDLKQATTTPLDEMQP